jgi:hypothetical protein
MKWSQSNSGEADYDRMTRAQAAYWWYADHHGGQFSQGYKRFCSVARVYTPGLMEWGPNTDQSIELYLSMCEENGCEHDGLSGIEHARGDR